MCRHPVTQQMIFLFLNQKHESTKVNNGHFEINQKNEHSNNFVQFCNNLGFIAGVDEECVVIGCWRIINETVCTCMCCYCSRVNLLGRWSC